MISLEEIRRRMGYSHDGEKYFGFDMTKDGSEKDKEVDKHNKELLNKFEDQFDVEYIFKQLDVWKGVVSWINEYTEKVINFGGWGSDQIIEILIQSKGFDEQEKKNSFSNGVVIRNVSPTMRYKILKEQRWRCNVCGIKLKYNVHSLFGEEVAHVDHIHPFSKRLTYINGEDNINERQNLQALCKKCNKQKSMKEIH